MSVTEEVKTIIVNLLKERPVRHSLIIKEVFRKRRSESRVRQALEELKEEKEIGVLKAHTRLSLYFYKGQREKAERMLLTKNKARIYPEYNFASKTNGRKGIPIRKLKENFIVKGAQD